MSDYVLQLCFPPDYDLPPLMAFVKQHAGGDAFFEIRWQSGTRALLSFTNPALGSEDCSSSSCRYVSLTWACLLLLGY